MVARRVSMLKFMFEGVHPWTKIMAFFIGKLGIKFGSMQVEAYWWNVVDSQWQMKSAKYWVVNQFVSSWQCVRDFIQWNPLVKRLYANALKLEFFGNFTFIGLGR